MPIHSRVYDSYPQAEQAIRELEAGGVAARDISVVAKRDINATLALETSSPLADRAGAGATVGGGSGLPAGLGLILLPGLGPVVAAGWLAATAAGAVTSAAAGGLTCALMDAGVSRIHAQTHSELVRRGGTLVAVRSSLSNVEAIMARHRPIDPAEHRSRSGPPEDPKDQLAQVRHHGAFQGTSQS